MSTPKPVKPSTPRQRLDATKASCPLAKYDYVQVSPEGRVLQVHCKLCGKLIYGKRMGPIVSQYKDKASNTVILERETSLGPLNDYTMVRIEHKGGGSHVTPLCGACVKRGISPERMEAVYHADLDQMHGEMIQAFDKTKADRWLEQHIADTPVDVREEPVVPLTLEA